MPIRHCKQCGAPYNLQVRKRGQPPQFCTQYCRKTFKAQYHKNYDAQPNQLIRRRDYMRKQRENG